MKIYIGGKEYTVQLAATEEQREVGLQNKKELAPDEGMLFTFEEIDEVSMWMKNTSIPLDIVFINEDLEVISVYEGTPNSEELITEDNVGFVLEVNAKSGIKKGDELEFSTPSVKKEMLVLDENGNPQMKLQGGERIFSRPHTKTLIKFAKKAYSTKADRDYKALGKRVFKFLEKQDSTDDEYV